MDKDKDREPGTGNRERETFADIAADIRDRAYVCDRHGEAETSNGSVAAMLRDIANRIDAAEERERERAEAMSLSASIVARKEEAAEWRRRIGNFAVRKALDKFIDILRRADCRYTKQKIDQIQAAYDEAKAALAAPARNCDRFATAYEALKAWEGGLDTAEDIVRMITWLLGEA